MQDTYMHAQKQSAELRALPLAGGEEWLSRRRGLSAERFSLREHFVRAAPRTAHRRFTFCE